MSRFLIPLAGAILALVALILGLRYSSSDLNQIKDGSGSVRVRIEGGHETVPVDRGRPVILIASALGVAPEVFRDAFSNVRPAPGGTHPTGERVRQNKEVLMKALGPHGITNDRLDTVSNYYRYDPGQDEMWPIEPATAYAIVEKGRLLRIEVSDGGSGYSSDPKITIPGFENVSTEVTLAYGKDFDTNGSIQSIDIVGDSRGGN